MTLTFGITKNPRGFQAECLEYPELVACGWTWQQLTETILDHTAALFESLKKSEPTTNLENTDVFCGFIKLEINELNPDQITISHEQNNCQ